MLKMQSVPELVEKNLKKSLKISISSRKSKKDIQYINKMIHKPLHIKPKIGPYDFHKNKKWNHVPYSCKSK